MPKRKKNEASKLDIFTDCIFLGIVIIVIVVMILYNNGVFSGFYSGDRIINIDSGTIVKETVKLDADIVENTEISYPGYGELRFATDKKIQDIYLTNPEENTCYFVMYLYLPDGTLIWQSEELMPGNAFNRIELDEPLETGVYYGSTLQYQGYSLKDGHQLNGATINLTIVVS